MSYQHLTTYERGCIEALDKIGYSAREIAKEIGRHHSTISRELAHINSDEYCSEKAQQDYEERRKNSGPHGKYTVEIAEVIRANLSATWSPEQIANTVLLWQISFRTIYNWLYSGKIPKVTLDVLRQKGKRHGPSETRGKFTIGMSIHSRPDEIKTRKTFGHWELDTMVSSRGKSKACFATFLERKSRLYTAFKIPDRTSKSMAEAISRLKSILPEDAFKTATVDRGKEFACYDTIEKRHGIPVYFADPYSSWQRGSNENSNGLLREFYPKRTDLATVDEDELATVLFLINSRPRKCLGWKFPLQIFLREVSHLI